MAWKPKTIAGKILKGVAIAGGSALALGTGVGAIAGAVGGTGLIAGAVGGAAKVVKTVAGIKAVKGTAAMVNTGTTPTKLQFGSKIKESVANLVSGKTAEQRELIAQAKKEIDSEKQKVRTMEKLIQIGIEPAAARTRAGLSPEDMPEIQGIPVKSAGVGEIFNNPVVKYVGIGAVALFILKKLKVF